MTIWSVRWDSRATFVPAAILDPNHQSIVGVVDDAESRVLVLLLLLGEEQNLGPFGIGESPRGEFGLWSLGKRIFGWLKTE